MQAFDNAMIARRAMALAVAASTVALAACGGGGGGGGGAAAAAAAGNRSLAAPTLSGGKTGAAVLVYVPNTAVGPADAQVPASSGSAIAAFAANDANASMTAGSLSTGTMNRNTGNAATSPIQDYGPNAAGSSLLTSKAVDASTVLDYSTYGVVVSAPPAISAGSSAGGYHYGTPATEMPKNASAIYSGVFAGLELSQSNLAPVVGSTLMIANFGNGAVTGRITNVKVDPLQIGIGIPAGYGIGFQGQISGTGYTGTARFTDTTVEGVTIGTTTASALNGGFYGPGAAETAGAIAMKGTPNGNSSSTIAIVGAYGAKK